MQRKFFIVLALFAGTTGRAQLQVQDRGILYVADGAILTVQGNIDSKADILGPGTVLLKGVSLQQVNMNGFLIPTLQLDNKAGASLEGDVHIGNRLVLSTGSMSLNAANLFLDAGAVIAGYDKDHYLITNGQGMLIRRALGHAAFTFPVGGSGDRYNPLTLSQAGTIHDIGLRAMPGILSNGESGIPLTSAAVNVSWELKELTTGTNDLVMIADWDAGDELPGFDRSHAGIVRYEDGKGWDRMAAGDVSVVEGRYTMAVVGQARTGVFSIATIEAAAGAESIRVFPNPARMGFYVYLPAKAGEKTVLHLFDLRGRLVKSQEVSGAGEHYFVLDEGIAAGTYLLQVMHEGVSVGSKKIVVVKP
ncbi:T9SS type A sorting domain-containing protein [Puia dinghuensis]|uniref:Secretion system C-terminal sorting domain-containing protein n=1 Tax=Puia dinghuensis TaxID=1792502 RepID=A0A8J2UCL8_9BACT|nr:T9SS type A sorting domain-containing protein [Puia dinghuensis]GGA97069.1 hypothetical protein GCM10011511_20480 [Puia dinghuensis]